MRAPVRFAIRLVGRESSLTTRVRKQEKVLPEREVSSCVWTVSSRLQTSEGIPGWKALLSLRAGYEAGCVVTRLSKEGELCPLQGCVLLGFRLRAGTCSPCPRYGHQRAMLPSMWQRNTVERDHTFQLCFLGTQPRRVQENVLKLVSVCPETVPYSEQNLVSMMNRPAATSTVHRMDY